MAEQKKPKRKILKRLFIVFAIILAAVALFSAYFFLTLPDVAYLKKQNPKTTALIEQRLKQAEQEGRTLNIRQEWVGFEVIPLSLKLTVLVSEDAAFYKHKGIDFYELIEAFKQNWKEGKKVRGGSTITQQLAKNLFLSTEKSYYRKLKELFIAKKLEDHLSKDRIFHLYLNVIEWGRGIFGVEAASEYYFKKPVDRLNLNEIIRLVSVLPRPLKVTPLSDSRYLKGRANLLLDRLHKYYFITPEQYLHAKKEFKD